MKRVVVTGAFSYTDLSIVAAPTRSLLSDYANVRVIQGEVSTK